MAKKSKKVMVTIFGSSTTEQKFFKKLMADSELNKFIGFEKNQSASDRLKFLSSEYLRILEVQFKKKLAVQKQVKEKVQPVETNKLTEITEIDL